jgi:hypothetical protein
MTERTPLQEHLFHATAAAMTLVTNLDVAFQDAGKLPELQARLPELLKDIIQAVYAVQDYEVRG